MFDPQEVLACPASGSLTLGSGRHERHEDASRQAKNPNGDSADTIERTATHNGTVSMVTGEGLLPLTDGTLDGILPSISPASTAPVPSKSTTASVLAGAIRCPSTWNSTASKCCGSTPKTVARRFHDQRRSAR